MFADWSVTVFIKSMGISNRNNFHLFSNDLVNTLAMVTKHVKSPDLIDTEQDDILNAALALYISVYDLKKLVWGITDYSMYTNENDKAISWF